MASKFVTIGVRFSPGGKEYTYLCYAGIRKGDYVSIYSEYPSPGMKIVKVSRVDDGVNNPGNYSLGLATRTPKPRPTEAMMQDLWKLCEGFIEKNKISCPESISQCDWVMENAYEFIEEVCDIVGYKEEDND